MSIKVGFEEARKMQLTGRSTYIVSLPKKWVKEMKLNPGDQLIIKRHSDAALLISPKLKKIVSEKDASLKISPEDNPEAIARKIISLYLIGYNTIKLNAENDRISSEQRRVIKEIVRRKLIGAEIITDSPSEMSLKILLSYPELSIETALRRMCSLARSMHKDALTALIELNYDLAKSIIDLDDEVDRFNLYIVRQLKSAVQDPYEIKEMGLTNPRDCLGYRLVTKSVERIADHAARIAEKVLVFKNQLNEATIKKLMRMNEFADSVLEMSINALLSRNYNLAEEALEKTYEIESLEAEAVNHLLKQGFTTEEISNLRLILESVRRVAEYANDIAEIVLNLAILDLIFKS
ncbi:phosphate uptake regulator PhoU [Candidatus Bathyarchaeota archaeon]|nr:phosphate uptake regulator PhoU [Candidatus Bathyarchaeota archaeon]